MLICSVSMNATSIDNPMSNFESEVSQTDYQHLTNIVTLNSTFTVAQSVSEVEMSSRQSDYANTYVTIVRLKEMSYKYAPNRQLFRVRNTIPNC